MFRFKQFSINDDGATMKVGTDAVLLGAIAECQNANRILDIGAGCGVVALIMAQRNATATVHAVEPDSKSVQLSADNFAMSSWKDRLTAFETSIQDFAQVTQQQYDCIVSNPPFFRNSLKSPSERRSMARHDNALTFEELSEAVAKLLSPNGIFTAILPCTEAEFFMDIAENYGLFLEHRNLVYSKPDGKPIRNVFVLKHDKKNVTTTSSIAIYNSDGTCSAAYRKLTEDLYLWNK
ncbi:MAG: methyltransferase [Bacteroidales bacterium]|nr:methyltransferase [Bacteroidales bacterium]